MSPPDEIQAEVRRRLHELSSDPDELLRRFDADADGTLDAQEWAAAHAAVQREAAAAHGVHEEPEVLDGRYALLAHIGSGAQGRTHLARRIDDAQFVAIKELRSDRMLDWDALALFEREARVHAGLRHESIPKFLERFDLEHGDTKRWFIVQEFVPGWNLGALLRSGALFDEARARRVALAILDTLVYLHGHSPPVLHRDIKPENIIERPDGTFALVDFGAVHSRASGSTIVGTTGYMPPEQLMGLADGVSDLYALGATIIHLLTRTHPTDLIDESLRIVWRRRANVSGAFADWLDQLVAPFPEDRPTTSILARSLLKTTSLAVKHTRAPGRRRSFDEPTDFLVQLSDDDLILDFGSDRPRSLLVRLGLLVAMAGIALPGVLWIFAGVHLAALAGVMMWFVIVYMTFRREVIRVTFRGGPHRQLEFSTKAPTLPRQEVSVPVERIRELKMVSGLLVVVTTRGNYMLPISGNRAVYDLVDDWVADHGLLR